MKPQNKNSWCKAREKTGSTTSKSLLRTVEPESTWLQYVGVEELYRAKREGLCDYGPLLPELERGVPPVCLRHSHRKLREMIITNNGQQQTLYVTWLSPCTFACGVKIVLPKNSHVVPVQMGGDRRRGFATKHTLDVKNSSTVFKFCRNLHL